MHVIVVSANVAPDLCAELCVRMLWVARVVGWSTGNKVLAVFGQVGMYGVVRASTWTRLAATAAAGTNTLVLSTSVDWRVGEQIGLSPTEFNCTQVGWRHTHAHVP